MKEYSIDSFSINDIKEGKIILIIPSGLAYGNTSTNSIPENSVLIFRIKLLEIR